MMEYFENKYKSHNYKSFITHFNNFWRFGETRVWGKYILYISHGFLGYDEIIAFQN